MSEPETTLRQKTATGVAWISAFQVIRQLLQLVSVSVLARYVPPAAYGLVAMSALLTNLLETVRDLGTRYALVREREMPDELVSTVFWLNCILGGTTSLLLVGLSWPGARFFHTPQVAPVIQFVSLSFFLGALGVVPTAMLNRAMTFRKIAYGQTAGAICGTVVAIAIAIAGGGVWSLVVGTLANTLVTTVAMWIYAPVRIMAVFRPSGAIHILRFGIHLTGSILMNYFSRNTDNLLVGRYLGSAPLGFYQMGYMLMTYPLQNFTTLVGQVVYPAMAKFPDDLDRLRAAYLRTCRLIALPILPIMLGLAVTAPSFVRVFLGARWMPVATLLIIFAPLGAAQALYGTVGLIYNTQGRPDIQLRWTAFASVMYVLSFVTGLRWGIVGVASAYATMWTVLMVPSFVIPFRLIDLSGKKFVQTLWPTIWSSLAMAGVSWLWLRALHRVGIHNAPAELVSATIVGASVYVGLTLWRKPLVLADLGNTLVGLPSPLIVRFGHYVSKLAGRAGEPGAANVPRPSTAPD